MLKHNILKIYFATVIIVGLLLWFTNHPMILPLALLYAFIIPGSLLLLSIKKKFIITWESFVLIIGLGVASLMFIALLINTIGIQLGASAPLSKYSLIVSMGAFSMLMLVGQRRWHNSPIEASTLKIKPKEIVIVIGALTVLIGLILGAIRLNNGAPGTLSIFFFFVIVAISAWLLKKSDTFSQTSMILSLWLMGLGVLLSGWLRSAYVSGPDISLEYSLAHAVQANGAWYLDSISNAYNSCLSVVLIVPSLGMLLNVDTNTVIKLIMPIIYSAIIPIIFLISKKFFGVKGAILSVLFFISQPPFISWWWTPVRQQIAFVFFALLILVLVNVKRRTKIDMTLILIFGTSLIVSHYSTAFLSIIYLIIVWLFVNLLQKIYKSRSINITQPVSIRVIVAIFMIFFLWYSQVTFGFSGFVTFATKTITNFGQIFNPESQASGQDIFSQFNIFSKQGASSITLEDYVANKKTISESYFGEDKLYGANYDSEIKREYYENTPTPLNEKVELTRRIILVISKVLLAASVASALWLLRFDKQYKTYTSLAVPALFLVLMSMLLPSFSVNYDQVRTYQQMLIIIGGVYGVTFIFKGKRKEWSIGVISTFTMLHFIFVSCVPLAFTNSSRTPMNFSSSGIEYESKYVHSGDVMAGRWLSSFSDSRVVVASDGVGRDKLRLSLTPVRSGSVLVNVIPSALPINSYVFESAFNRESGKAYVSINNDLLIHTFPSSFLSDEKNIIYSNGQDNFYR